MGMGMGMDRILNQKARITRVQVIQVQAAMVWEEARARERREFGITSTSMRNDQSIRDMQARDIEEGEFG
jgi:hypothetical protein